MLGHHLFDNRLDEVDVAIATSIPCPIYAIGEDDHELSRVTYGLHTHLFILELVVLHPVGILVVTVTEDEQRAVLAKVLGCIDIIRTVETAYSDVVCLHRQDSCCEQDER